MIITIGPGETGSYPVPGYFFYYNRGVGEIRVTLYDDEGNQEPPAILLPGQGIDSKTRFDRFEIENLHDDEQELHLEIRRSRFVDNRTSNKLTVVTNDGEPLQTEFSSDQLPLPVVVQNQPEPSEVPETFWYSTNYSANENLYLKTGVKAIEGESAGFIGFNLIRCEIIRISALRNTYGEQHRGLMLRFGVSNNPVFASSYNLISKADPTFTSQDMRIGAQNDTELDSQLNFKYFCDYIRTEPNHVRDDFEVYKPGTIISPNDPPLFVPVGYNFVVQSEGKGAEITILYEAQPVFSS